MDNIVNGLVGLAMTILKWLESTLGDGMALTGLPQRVEAAVWVVIVLLCLIVAFRLISGNLRTLVVAVILVISVHAGLTHGMDVFRQ